MLDRLISINDRMYPTLPVSLSLPSQLLGGIIDLLFFALPFFSLGGHGHVYHLDLIRWKTTL